MKKIKAALWIIMIGFVGLVVFQNWDYFDARQALNIDLFVGEYLTPEFSNFLFFAACFLIGLLLAYIYGLVSHFRSTKLIKNLNAATEAQQEEISGLKRELEMLQRSPSEDEHPPAETSDTVANI